MKIKRSRLKVKQPVCGGEKCGALPGGASDGGCLICGAELVYGGSTMRTCHVCGRKKPSNALCENGHFVCDGCHAYGAYAPVVSFLKNSGETDPLKLFAGAVKISSVHMHGPEHHFIVPMVLLTAYRNCGGKLNYDVAMGEAHKRGGQIPGGTCGYWGVCGAAAGAGVYASIITGSTPLNREVWSLPQKLTAEILKRIASYGGPRCCKRTGMTAIITASEFTTERLGVTMKTEREVCGYFGRNRECIKNSCPYYSGESV